MDTKGHKMLDLSVFLYSFLRSSLKKTTLLYIEPLGHQRHSVGPSSSANFICGFPLADGRRYGLHK